MKTLPKVINQLPSQQFKVVQVPAFHRIEIDSFKQVLSNKILSSFQKIACIYVQGNKNSEIDLSVRKLSKMFDCSRRSIERAKSFLLSQDMVQIKKKKRCHTLCLQNNNAIDTEESLFTDFDSSSLRDFIKSDNFTYSSKLLFLYFYIIYNAAQKKCLREGIEFEGFSRKIQSLVEETSMSKKTIKRCLNQLKEEKLLNYVVKNDKLYIKLNAEKYLGRKNKNNSIENEKNFALKGQNEDIKEDKSRTLRVDKSRTLNNKQEKNNKLKNNKVLSFEVNLNVFEKKRREKEISNKAKNQNSPIIKKDDKNRSFQDIANRQSQNPIIKNSRQDDLKKEVVTQTNLQNDSIRQKLISYFGDPIYRSWFRDVRFDEITLSKVVMSVPTSFYKSYIKTNYAWDLEKLFGSSNSQYFDLQITVDKTLKNETLKGEEVEDNYKIDELTKEQKIKVANYASKLCKNNLRKGYAASIEKIELTKQMLYHTCYWRPTSNPYISPEDSFEVSLKVAYSKIKGGMWNMPKGYK